MSDIRFCERREEDYNYRTDEDILEYAYEDSAKTPDEMQALEKFRKLKAQYDNDLIRRSVFNDYILNTKELRPIINRERLTFDYRLTDEQIAERQQFNSLYRLMNDLEVVIKEGDKNDIISSLETGVELGILRKRIIMWRFVDAAKLNTIKHDMLDELQVARRNLITMRNRRQGFHKENAVLKEKMKKEAKLRGF